MGSWYDCECGLALIPPHVERCSTCEVAARDAEKLTHLEAELARVEAERDRAQRQARDLRADMGVMGEGFAMVCRALGYTDEEVRDAMPPTIASDIRVLGAHATAQDARLSRIEEAGRCVVGRNLRQGDEVDAVDARALTSLRAALEGGSDGE